MFLASAMSNVPRYILGFSVGEKALGSFAAMIYFVTVGSVFISALGQSASPRLSKLYVSHQDEKFRRLLTRLIGSGVAVGATSTLIAAVFGKQILSNVYSHEYAAYQRSFVVILASSILLYCGNFLGYAVTSMRFYHFYAKPYTVVAAVVVIFAIVTIPAYGLAGATATVAISGLMNVLAPLFALKRGLRAGKTRQSALITETS
jgi:O-antigen/teichoic acid export membrane protein